MMLSPELRTKLRKFRKNKRGYYSMLILCVLFLLTLPTELVLNDRPIVLKIDGHWFFPVFAQYTYKDFGGTMNVPVVSYRSDMFKNFVAGKEPVVNTAALFPPENLKYDPSAEPATNIAAHAGSLVTYGAATKRDVWALWPRRT